jgi:hypothetical protein
VQIINIDATGGILWKTLNNSSGSWSEKAGLLLTSVWEVKPDRRESSSVLMGLQSVGNGAGGMHFPAPRIAECLMKSGVLCSKPLLPTLI